MESSTGRLEKEQCRGSSQGSATTPHRSGLSHASASSVSGWQAADIDALQLPATGMTPFLKRRHPDARRNRREATREKKREHDQGSYSYANSSQRRLPACRKVCVALKPCSRRNVRRANIGQCVGIRTLPD
ncbi:hypothetical protein CTA1_842 [Colletotrichum tanaceti]|uniref:Uncharacterized protein n=1 Tax=Colletotrichum tanaceti TaxID=1306861 RepID=A0A4U6X6C3_9PEZI|nr:hypothetical protein CTA1_842 [Colletotrichum tanaceti]